MCTVKHTYAVVLSLFLGGTVLPMESASDTQERERTHSYYVGCCALVTGVVSLTAGIGCGLFLGQAKGYAMASAVPVAIVAGGVCTVAGCFARSCVREDERRADTAGESRYGSVML